MKLSSLLTIGFSSTIIMSLLASFTTGELPVSIYIAIIYGLVDLMSFLSWRITYTLVEFSKNQSYIRDVISFFKQRKLENSSFSNDKFDFCSVEFLDVSYKYPGADTFSVKNLSFSLDKGESIAFVGENGSGKSTVIKLMIGLLKPTSGKILINGVCTSAYSVNDLQKDYSISFQDYAKYPLTIIENIIFDNHFFKKSRFDQIAKTLELSNMIRGLDNGLNEKLGKVGGGSLELSEGEWQKIAVFRNLITDRGLNIFDEPTAALNPITEKRLFDNFMSFCQGKAIVLVSHRLASVTNCDRIFVLEKGACIERGSHLDLIKKSGKYKFMFTKQKEMYEVEKTEIG